MPIATTNYGESSKPSGSSKTDLHTRPVYVRTPAHIEAHFAICFLALLVTRLLERRTQLPSGQLLSAIRDLQAIPVADAVYRIIRPATWDIIDHAIGVSLDQSWATLTELRSWKRYLTRTAKTTTFATPTKPQKANRTPQPPRKSDLTQPETQETICRQRLTPPRNRLVTRRSPAPPHIHPSQNPHSCT